MAKAEVIAELRKRGLSHKQINEHMVAAKARLSDYILSVVSGGDMPPNFLLEPKDIFKAI